MWKVNWGHGRNWAAGTTRCTELAGIDPSARLLSRISAISSWPVSVSPRTAMTSIAEPSTRPATVGSRFFRVTGIGTGRTYRWGRRSALAFEPGRRTREVVTRHTTTPLIEARHENRVIGAKANGQSEPGGDGFVADPRARQGRHRPRRSDRPSLVSCSQIKWYLRLRLFEATAKRLCMRSGQCP